MYKIGIKSLFSMVQSSPQFLHPSIYTLLAVLGNNLGCIAAEEYDYETIDQCVEWTIIEHIPTEVPSMLLNHESWCCFRSKPAPAA